MRGVRRVELVVVGALVLSAPSILQAFSGGIAPATALFRLAGALAVCWAVGAIVERTIDSYARQARQQELAERMEQLRAQRGTVLAPQPAEVPPRAAPATTSPSEVAQFQ